eukprot:CAMPEP_0197051562 /NCGR_PEP_ID=MMETSP1384-20130603/26199_1 /TAXON_ID=29189 /ORGANISM="Ammonia sp." /LENGTH=252 /DNA_ID=CAMNT_0042484147 /DNA_START=35 /DNA_END=793 /DNA_ORIENTATION=+
MMEPEVEITQADESQYLSESIRERKDDIKKQDLETADKSLFLNWKENVLAKTPTLEEDAWSILRGFRNGLMYGVKIRLPHAFVMTLLFSHNRSITNMSSVIIKKTQEHSVHLGKYVMLYKLLIVLIRRILNYPHNHFPIIHLLAGGIGGGIIWGQRTAVNHQINLYVFSRIFMGLIRSGVERGYFDGKLWKQWYLLFAAVTWAIVMYLFEFEEHNLSRSLAASMRYLYHNEMKTPSDLRQVWHWMSTSSVPS